MPDTNAFDPIDTYNGMLGMLYDKLTGGEDRPLRETGYFFSWRSIGLPVSASEWSFMSGVIKPPVVDDIKISEPKKKVLAGDGDADTDPDAEETTEQPDVEADADDLEPITFTEADAERYALRCAEAFFNLVDFVPAVSGKLDLDARPEVILERRQGATLVGEYARVLRECQVARIEQSEESKQKIAQLQGMLGTTVEMKNAQGEPMINPMTGKPITQYVESDIMKAYRERQQATNDALREMHNMRIEAQVTDDPRAVLEWSNMGPIKEQNFQMAEQMWEAAGFRSMVDGWLAEINRLTADNIVSHWAELSSKLEAAERKGMTGATFYDASLISPQIMESSSWTRFELNSSNIQKYANRRKERFGAEANVPIPKTPLFVDGKHEQEKTKRLNKMSMSNLSIAFEITEVEINRRAYLDVNFLLNNLWRFPEGAEPLNDGGDPPQGSLVAIPNSIILVRNLELSFDELKSESDFKHDVLDQEAGFSVFGLNLGARVSRGKDVVENSYTYDKASGSIRVDGAQVIGFRNQLLGKAPDPDSAVRSWIGSGGEFV